jgi:hypothetical protein
MTNLKDKIMDIIFERTCPHSDYTSDEVVNEICDEIRDYFEEELKKAIA